ncbi:GNAT family N-acetyltransferase [Agrobacterium tumefaciens]|uniref:GNAT family N-acetyltransferase n=1 Tax=Agrobacterium tumefaciens TaxID=358 RepID=UPI001572E76E|nr:GNAT family N-acetyltransferase [Agrobacterium tumefaciens]NTB99216.1 GNAT family N-acetyltransferase [Agrobacterium tumefaciens]NTC47413.1 GNAT family N-acetyltransferase [Agrobacterium tumefaciens]
MQNLGSSNITLRPAIGADESFILKLEQVCLQKQVLELLGRWVPRPGMGAGFPNSSRLIQLGGKNIGCLTLTNDERDIHIDQLYLVPETRGLGIGTQIVSELIARTEEDALTLKVSLFANNPHRRFFEKLGFTVARSTSNRILMERPSRLPERH